MRDYTVHEQPAAWMRWVEWMLYPLLFAAALLPRILHPAAFVAEGEISWAFRSFQFWQALWLGNSHLLSLGSPAGAVAHWASAVSPTLVRVLAGAGPAPRWLGLAALPELDLQSAEQVRLAAAYWPIAKLPLAALNALLITLAARLARRLWGLRAGFLLGLVLTVAPYHLALSHILGDEAVTAGLSLVALLSLLVALRRPHRWPGYLPAGALLGLALLNGRQAAPLVPYGLLLVATAHLYRKRKWALLARHAVLWCVAALGAALLAWPAAYVQPLATALGDLLPQMAAGLGWGLSRETLLALALRQTPLTAVGLALALMTLPWAGSLQRGRTLALLGWAVVGVLFAAPGGADDPRWLLPAAVALDAAAAVGLATVIALAARGVERVLRKVRTRAKAPAMNLEWRFQTPAVRLGGMALRLALSVAAVAGVAWQGLAVLRYRPYYAVYRNPWLSAAAAEPGRGLSSWGEGLDQAAHYLDAQPNAGAFSAATLHVDALAPYFRGQVTPLNPQTLLSADYVVLYRTDWEQPEPWLQDLVSKEPVKRFGVFGAESARLYANRVHEPVLRVLGDATRPDDVVVVDAITPLQQHYRGAALMAQVGVTTAEQAALDLSRLALGRWRLWHVAFGGADPQGIMTGLLETQAVLVERWPVSGAVVSLYLLPLQPQFHALEADREVQIALAPSLTLARVGVSSDRVQYRQQIHVALAWRVEGRPAGNLALSLRLLDAQGQTWAQQDEWISDAQGRSTAAWSERGEVETRHRLAVPPAAPPGLYRLQGVFYDADSPQRTGAECDLASLEIRPAQLPPTSRDLVLPRRVQIDLAEDLEIVGYEIGAATLRPGQKLPVRIWWHSAQPVTATYQAQLILLDAKGHERGNQVVELAGPEHPTPLWIAGEIIEGRYSVPVDAQAAPGEALLGVQLVGLRGAVGQAVRLGSVQVQAIEHNMTVPDMQNRRLETLDKKVRLLGYDLVEAAPGETAQLTLYWQDLAPITGDYAVFVHLLDAQGQIRAAHDGIPAEGERPTPGWVLHEVVTDRHPIALPKDLPPGEYTLAVGLYDAATGVRLPAYDGSLTRLAEDRIVLGKVNVRRKP